MGGLRLEKAERREEKAEDNENEKETKSFGGAGLTPVLCAAPSLEFIVFVYKLFACANFVNRTKL